MLSGEQTEIRLSKPFAKAIAIMIFLAMTRAKIISQTNSQGLKNGMKLTTATALKPCKDCPQSS